MIGQPRRRRTGCMHSRDSHCILLRAGTTFTHLVHQSDKSPHLLGSISIHHSPPAGLCIAFRRRSRCLVTTLLLHRITLGIALGLGLVNTPGHRALRCHAPTGLGRQPAMRLGAARTVGLLEVPLTPVLSIVTLLMVWRLAVGREVALRSSRP